MNFCQIIKTLSFLFMILTQKANAVEVYGVTDVWGGHSVETGVELPERIAKRVGFNKIALRGSLSAGWTTPNFSPNDTVAYIQINFSDCFNNPYLLSSGNDLCVVLSNKKSQKIEEQTRYLAAYSVLYGNRLKLRPDILVQGLDLLPAVADMLSASTSIGLEQYKKIQQLKKRNDDPNLTRDLTQLIGAIAAKIPNLSDSDALTTLELFELYIKISTTDTSHVGAVRRPIISGGIFNNDTLIIAAENIPLATSISKAKSPLKAQDIASSVKVLIIKFTKDELNRLIKKAPSMSIKSSD